ncbi:hypothetical protein CFOLD11_10800 [Clostridium folliculivorans]|uniref:DUF2283 domain-containing protein n=1 Tax=Clostridium folliculivorans TaxID=2886038 RepID=A0A9W6D9L0_9CLOT|nr:hypothetical protein CFOLD11_10800 [Clostridium folliculivorans]
MKLKYEFNIANKNLTFHFTENNEKVLDLELTSSAKLILKKLDQREVNYDEDNHILCCWKYSKVTSRKNGNRSRSKRPRYIY